MTRRRQDRREPSIRAILQLADRIGLESSTVQSLVTAAVATDHPTTRRRVMQRLAALAARDTVQPFPQEQMTQELPEPEIDLGTTITGSAYTLPQDDLTHHLLAVGKSGAGKTTLLYNMMDQVSVPFWAFDLKRDYRHLVQEMDDLLVLPWTEFRFNPLKPPDGVRPRQWAQVFSETFGHATALLSGSKNYLMQQIIALYRLYDLFDEVAGPYPSLHELQLLAERDTINYVRKSANYRDTLHNRLAAMNGTAGTIFDCSSGYPIEDLLDRNVVFEFNGLGTDVQNFLMEILFAYVFEYRLAQQQRGGDLRHVFFLDEGKRIFSVYKERQDAAGLPKIDELTAKMREFGEGLVVADQEASKLTNSIKANTDTKVLLSTGDAKQFREMTESMFLSDRQQEVAQDIGIGEAIVQTGNRDPVPVNLANYELAKSVSDQELRERQSGLWNDLSYEPRQTTPAFKAAVGGEDGEALEPDIPGDSEDALSLSDDAERLLEDVVAHPFRPLTERYELFSNMSKGTHAKSELVDKSVVVERQVAVQDVRRKLLELTTTGREYAEEALDLDVEHEGRGGVVHRFWQHRIRDVFEAAGWPASLELFDADVYVHMHDTELVVEVAMGDNPREVEHVESHVDTFDVVWVACPNIEIIEGLRERLAEQDAMDECVSFHPFQFFVEADHALFE